MEGTATTNPGVVAKKGDAAPVSMSINDFNKPNENTGGAEGSGGAETPEQKLVREALANETPEQKAAREALANETPEQKLAREKAAAGTTTTLTEDQIKAGLEALGIKVPVGGLNEIKEKINTQPAAELTEEQKQKAAKEKDEKLLQLYTAGGGTIEQYVAMKSLLTANPDEISSTQIKKELKDAGFSDDDVKAIIAERYYQIDLDKLERTTDESEEDFKKRKDDLAKKVALGKNKITSRGAKMINQAKTFFTGLEEAMSIQESLAKKETEFSSKVDEMASKLDKKVKIELGKINNKDMPPIEFEISAEDITEVTGILKDKAKRESYFNNKDSGLNLENVLTLMLRNKYLENAVKVGYISGVDKSVADFRKVFPGANAHDIGLGGNNSSTSSNGKAAKAGKPTPMPVTLK